MPRKAMKCIIEVDLHVMTCPGTFLREYEYVYLHLEMLGLEARTKSVPPTFPLFFHERLKFERTFHDCTDPSIVANLLKGEDLVIELCQHTDYVTDGKVIAHCSSNTHDFLYPSIPAYYGSGREILLYKTSKFKPIRVTGEPVKLEFSTKTVIKEVTDVNNNVISSARRSPTKSPERFLAGSATTHNIPAWQYRHDFSGSSRHQRSTTAPDAPLTSIRTPVKHLEYSMDDLNLSSTKYRRRHFSPNLSAALRSSERIQRRVDDVLNQSDEDSDYTLDLLRESLRDERNALNDAIKEADREAFHRSLNRTR